MGIRIPETEKNTIAGSEKYGDKRENTEKIIKKFADRCFHANLYVIYCKLNITLYFPVAGKAMNRLTRVSIPGQVFTGNSTQRLKTETVNPEEANRRNSFQKSSGGDRT